MINRVYEDFLDKKIIVIGLGYVGLTLSVVMAEAGFEVIGVEINPETLSFLKNNKPHFYEPGLDFRLEEVLTSKQFRIFEKIPHLEAPATFIITVGTPLGIDGLVNLDMVKKVTNEVAESMIGGSLVIGRSTLMIGTMDKIVKPILDKSKKVYDLAFCPERTLEGKALEELKYLPQIIGSNSIKSANRAAQIFQFLTPTIIKVSSLKAAETIKLIDNVSRDVNFAFANEVATICDEIGINAYEVISAGKQGYPRTNIPLPGPVGGPCLSKDPYILIQSLSMREFKPKITISARETNEKISEYTSKVVLNHVKKFKNKYDSKLKISLLGLAFKGRPETDDLRGTTAIPIFNTLKDKFPGADFYGWDKLVNDNKIIKLGLIPLKSLDEAFENSDVVIILNNHKDFSNISLIHKSRKMNAYGLIYDLWNHFSNKKHNLENNVVYNALGNLENGDN